MKKYLAEFVGTFLLVFVSAGAVVADVYLAQLRVTDSFGPLGIALATGLAFAAAVAVTAHISGGHLNPAISLGAFVARRLPAAEFGAYVMAQLLGGSVAALLVRALAPGEAYRFAGGGIPGLGPGMDVAKGIGVEVILTFFLVIAFWATGVDRRGPASIAPLSIGLTLAACGIAGGAFTGAALNPARWFGPALVGGQFDNGLVWVVGPLIGGLLASLLYESFFMDVAQEPGVTAAREPEPVPVRAAPAAGIVETAPAGEAEAPPEPPAEAPPPESLPVAPRPPEPPQPGGARG